MASGQCPSRICSVQVACAALPFTAGSPGGQRQRCLKVLKMVRASCFTQPISTPPGLHSVTAHSCLQGSEDPPMVTGLSSPHRDCRITAGTRTYFLEDCFSGVSSEDEHQRPRTRLKSVTTLKEMASRASPRDRAGNPWESSACKTPLVPSLTRKQTWQR